VLAALGAWGTGIFSDDTAADVRDDWREAIMDGLKPDQATDKLVTEHRETLDDVDDAIVFWLALAAAQQQTGRLVPAVRDRALEIIEAGGDVERWREENERLARRRAKVLAALGEKLRGPARAPTKLRRPKPHGPGLSLGDVVLIRGEKTDARALFVVVATVDAWPPGSDNPVVATLLWDGDDLPSAEQMQQLPLVRDDPRGMGHPHWGREHDVSLHGVWNPSRGKHALVHYGEVVARGVLRDDAVAGRKVDFDEISHSGWSFLSQWIEGEWYARCIELTKRVEDSTPR
jgi:hypothetical protein